MTLYSIVSFKFSNFVSVYFRRNLYGYWIISINRNKRCAPLLEGVDLYYSGPSSNDEVNIRKN